MKPVDKKDMPKLIALIGLTVCSLGYGIYSLVGSTSTAAPPPKKEEPAQSASAGAAPGTPGAVDDPMMTELKRLEAVSEPVLIRDPFIAPSGLVPPSPGPGTPPPPGPTAPVTNPLEARRDLAIARANERAIRLGELLGINVRVPKGGDSELMGGGGSSSSAPTNTHISLPPPQPPSIVVTGIMVPESGQGKSIAIIRVNDRPRWVSVGDRLENGFVVQSIRKTDSGSELEIADLNDKSRRFQPYRVN